MAPRYPASSLIELASALLERAGLEPEKAADVAAVLVEGDLLGHDTHGLGLLPLYLAELEKGSMSNRGGPGVVADFPAALTWDGKRLPGPWLVRRAIDIAVARAKRYGTCTVAIRRSHHLAALAAYLRPVAEQGMMILLTCSDPNVRGVAPHGGRGEVMTPNPIAAAWPTDGAPVMIDVSMSITTNGLTRRLVSEQRKFPGTWAIDADGNPTDDPARVLCAPPGALLPAGGLDHGHKGYALGLLVEALTGALAGHGRADPAEGWSANVLLQVFEPALFGGRADFLRQTAHLAAACRATPPRAGFERVRLPGEAALARRAEQLAHGVALYPSIMPALQPWCDKLGVPAPGSS